MCKCIYLYMMLLHISLGIVLIEKLRWLSLTIYLSLSFILKIMGFENYWCCKCFIKQINCLYYTDRCCKMKLLLPCKSLDNTLTWSNQFLCSNLITQEKRSLRKHVTGKLNDSSHYNLDWSWKVEMLLLLNRKKMD